MRQRRHPIERIVDKTVSVDMGYVSPCWRFTGRHSEKGYGHVGIGFKLDGSKTVGRVHKVAFEAIVGPVAPEHELDHLCLVKDCWRPDHLDAVTGDENRRRYFALLATA